MSQLAQQPIEQQLKHLNPIIDDVIRAYNLANYSLLWRYLSPPLEKTNRQQHFILEQQRLEERFGTIAGYEHLELIQEENAWRGKWLLKSQDDSQTLVLAIVFIEIKEFIAIDSYSFEEKLQ